MLSRTETQNWYQPETSNLRARPQQLPAEAFRAGPEAARGKREDGGGRSSPTASPGRSCAGKTLEPPLRSPRLWRRVLCAPVHGPGGKPRAPAAPHAPRPIPGSGAPVAPAPARSPPPASPPRPHPAVPDARQAPYPRGAGPRGALPRMSVPASSARRAQGPKHRAGASLLSRSLSARSQAVLALAPTPYSSRSLSRTRPPTPAQPTPVFIRRADNVTSTPAAPPPPRSQSGRTAT